MQRQKLIALVVAVGVGGMPILEIKHLKGIIANSEHVHEEAPADVLTPMLRTAASMVTASPSGAAPVFSARRARSGIGIDPRTASLDCPGIQ
jgi:hypothetical protein